MMALGKAHLRHFWEAMICLHGLFDLYECLPVILVQFSEKGLMLEPHVVSKRKMRGMGRRHIDRSNEERAGLQHL